MENRALGDYQLIKCIGQGSLGSVYLAEQRFMKRHFVLKLLPEELATDRGFIQRFEEEVSILSALEHPHLVKIHNVSFAQGQYFLVSDCIVDNMGETTNLAQYRQAQGRKKMDEGELLSMLRQIADALDYAHSKKVAGKAMVHRGLKPNNVLIGNNKGEREVYISDFGLSRIVGVGAVLTRTYKAVGEALALGSSLSFARIGTDRYPNPPIDQQKATPLHLSFLQSFAFLAPEQKRPDSPYTVDIKADIYAFGVLAYFLITGELPEGIFDKPSVIVPEYEFNWDLLIQKCLQFDPNLRPEVLCDVLDEVEKKVFASSYQQIAEEVPMQVKYAIPASALQPAVAAVMQEASSGLKPVIHAPQIERPEHDPDPAASFRVDSTVKQYRPEQKEVKNLQPILTDMAVIQGGFFWRGSSDGNRDESPWHQIILPNFAIDIHPVTNEQFARFLEVMGGEKDNNHNDIIRLRESRIKRTAGKISIESGYSKHPVVGVTWYGAVSYAKWVGKRLPSEAEWEIAARGGIENALYPTGDDIEKSQANFFSADTTSVMSYAPNGYGLFDIAGNVYEWCQDWYSYNSYETSLQEPENPKGPLQGVYRVLRGGCWKSLKEDLRCSRRHRNNPGTVNGTYGFRCATDVG